MANYENMSTNDLLNFDARDEVPMSLAQRQAIVNRGQTRKEQIQKTKAKETIAKYSKQRVEDHSQAGDRDIVIRAKDGLSPVMVFDAAISKSAINQLKVAYKNLNSIHYYDVRPCLYKNWVNWPDERQQGTQI